MKDVARVTVRALGSIGPATLNTVWIITRYADDIYTVISLGCIACTFYEEEVQKLL